MRRFRMLVVGVAVVVGLIGAAPTAIAGGPSEELVTIIGPVVDEVDCGGVSITRTESGWLGIPANVENLTRYHLTWVYSNADGNDWTFIDTGTIRTFERAGDLFVSLSGRSVNVGPDGTGWVGRWEINTTTQEVLRAGLGVGAIDHAACSLLAG